MFNIKLDHLKEVFNAPMKKNIFPLFNKNNKLTVEQCK